MISKAELSAIKLFLTATLEETKQLNNNDLPASYIEGFEDAMSHCLNFLEQLKKHGIEQTVKKNKI